MTQELQSDLSPSSAEIDGGLASHPLFSRPAIFTAYGIAFLIALVLIFSATAHNTALVQPIDPGFHAAMLGLGIFLGVVLAAIVTVGRTLGIGVGGGSPLQQSIATIAIPLLIVVFSGFAGSYTAERIVEWRAFHDMTPQTVDTEFAVTAMHHGKSGYSLELQVAGSNYSFSLGCSSNIYSSVSTGDRLILPVEIGRGGIERTKLPTSPTDLHHA